MDAREHRARAEQLLADVRRAQCDMSGRVKDTDITHALLAAQAHAAIYLGDQFAVEFDPRETADALLRDVRRASSVPRIDPADNEAAMQAVADRVHDAARRDGSVTRIRPRGAS